MRRKWHEFWIGYHDAAWHRCVNRSNYGIAKRHREAADRHKAALVECTRWG